eukprot:m.19838 g.19838  ORF g.19838 m.19838 type:complete len:199 (-) comp8506_c0_seq1:228-824(-)
MSDSSDTASFSVEFVLGEKYKQKQLERRRRIGINSSSGNSGREDDEIVPRSVGYTQWNCASVLLVSVFQIETLMPIVLCSCIGVVLSFHLGFLLEPDGVARLIKQNNLPTGWKFHILNSLIHVGPALWMAYLVSSCPSVDVALSDGLWASCLHLTWGLFQTKGTLLLDKVYAPMARWSWYAMWVTAVLSESLLTPWLF